MSAVVVRVSRHFDAAPGRVFDAWLDPSSAGRWLFATEDGQMQRVQIEPRVGGGYAIVERRGDVDAGHFGQYLQIDRPHRLVFTLGMVEDGSGGDRIAVEIVDEGKGSLLSLSHEMAAENAQYAERVDSGWKMVLDGLADCLAGSA
ncbi:SRPBCC domain-containing protein [Lysobacter sp. TAF61]|uniref:SRPBCC family protein n=1 Tax=Lysobacter sp. TAF61 TaxID=3233072 RepID=UPI003F967BAC